MHPGELQRRERVEIEIGEVGNVVDQIGHLGRAETRMVGRDDIEVLGEAIEQRGPFGEAIGAVEIKHWLTRAAPAQRQPGAVDVDRRGGESHGFLPPRRLWGRGGACKPSSSLPGLTRQSMMLGAGQSAAWMRGSSLRTTAQGG
jgi:hypothetical protein